MGVIGSYIELFSCRVLCIWPFVILSATLETKVLVLLRLLLVVLGSDCATRLHSSGLTRIIQQSQQTATCNTNALILNNFFFFFIQSLSWKMSILFNMSMDLV